MPDLGVQNLCLCVQYLDNILALYSHLFQRHTKATMTRFTDANTQSPAVRSLDKLVPLAEFAKRLGVSERTIYRWHARRKGVRRTVISRSIFFHEDDIAEWIDSQRKNYR